MDMDLLLICNINRNIVVKCMILMLMFKKPLTNTYGDKDAHFFGEDVYASWSTVLMNLNISKGSTFYVKVLEKTYWPVC